MITRLLFLLFTVCFSSNLLAQTDLWSKALSGTSYSYYQMIEDNEASSSGSVYTIGTSGYTGYSGTTTMGNLSVSDFGYDMVLMKHNPDGSIEWLKRGGSTSNSSTDGGAAVGLDPYGHVYAGGSFQGTGVFDNLSVSGTGSTVHDGFLVKYDTTGAIKWAIKQGGSGSAKVIDLAVDNAGNPITLTMFIGQLVIGSTTYSSTSSSSNNYMVTKYDSTGAVTWSRHIKIGNTVAAFDPLYINHGGIAVDGDRKSVV